MTLVLAVYAAAVTLVLVGVVIDARRAGRARRSRRRVRRRRPSRVVLEVESMEFVDRNAPRSFAPPEDDRRLLL